MKFIELRNKYNTEVVLSTVGASIYDIKTLDYENRFVIPLAYCEYCGVRLDIEKWKVKMKKEFN